MDKTRRDSRLPFQEIEGRFVVVVPARRELHDLNEVASFLWSELAHPRSVEELVEAVCGEFEVEADDADKDVRRFLDVLKEKGLVLAE